MEKMQKKALVIGLVFVVILNLFVIVWLVSDLFAGKEENPKGTVSSTEEITTEEKTEHPSEMAGEILARPRTGVFV